MHVFPRIRTKLEGKHTFRTPHHACIPKRSYNYCLYPDLRPAGEGEKDASKGVLWRPAGGGNGPHPPTPPLPHYGACPKAPLLHSHCFSHLLIILSRLVFFPLLNPSFIFYYLCVTFLSFSFSSLTSSLLHTSLSFPLPFPSPSSLTLHPSPSHLLPQFHYLLSPHAMATKDHPHLNIIVTPLTFPLLKEKENIDVRIYLFFPTACWLFFSLSLSLSFIHLFVCFIIDYLFVYIFYLFIYLFIYLFWCEEKMFF